MISGRLTTCTRLFLLFKLWRITSALFGYFKIMRILSCTESGKVLLCLYSFILGFKAFC
nr:MAG TPA: hypothetical protein [Herelleviridae sp.]